jgi:cation diffusion facilitator family transporter
MARIEMLALGSIAVGVAVLALKFLAFHLTGSVAFYSDALESIVNVVTAIATFVAVRASAKPADRDHPYGHHKAEYLSAVVEGVLIILASLSILREAYAALLTPRLLQSPIEGLLANGAATALNAVWCWILIRHGRRRRSPALIADGRHLLVDVITSLGVLAGVALAVATGWHLLDPVLAALVAVHILWSGWTLLRESVGGLMDQAVPQITLDRIRSLISSHASGALEAHDLRTRHAGRRTFVDFHLVVPGSMTVTEAHEICDRIEAALLAEVEDALISIHVEPDHKAKHTGVVVL